ncbi:recombinase [Thalassococcus sp. S3]|uniref:recombinase n=1 Tax=Thalassococcus sp. S3 TaxID=2017482 RepID=UPI001024080D|nr:recombinase [Thalassococcus sp. S3]QBF32167.1 recombinase [Thalassococcus sp. S3]
MIRAVSADDTAEIGTWDWVMQSWVADKYSRYHQGKQNTRESHDYVLRKLSSIIGHMRIEQLTYREMCQIREAMEIKKRSSSYKKKMFGMISTLARYAAGPLRQHQARDVLQDHGEIVIQSDPKRHSAPDAAMIRAIVDEADGRGLFAFATGLLIQWTYMLRAVDVRGQWLDAEEADGGLYRNGKRWQDGLTWDMFDADLTKFEKVISKTRNSLPETMTFTVTPEIRSRLALLSNDCRRVGPVIVSERYRRPYTRYSWSQAFRRIRDDLKLPETVWMMDTRAGAITEAQGLVSDPFTLRDAAQHLHVETTDGYARARSENINKVVQLRSSKKK